MAWLDLDGRLYRHRSLVTLIFVAVIIFQIATLALALLGVPWYPSEAFGHRTVPLLIINHVELLLTTGLVSVISQALPQPIHGSVQAVLKVHKSVRGPKRLPQFLAGHQHSWPFQ